VFPDDFPSNFYSRYHGKLVEVEREESQGTPWRMSHITANDVLNNGHEQLVCFQQ
jgi:hypothetical protein